MQDSKGRLQFFQIFEALKFLELKEFKICGQYVCEKASCDYIYLYLFHIFEVHGNF